MAFLNTLSAIYSSFLPLTLYYSQSPFPLKDLPPTIFPFIAPLQDPLSKALWVWVTRLLYFVVPSIYLQISWLYFSLKWTLFHFVFVPHLNYSFICWKTLGCLHFLAVVNEVAMYRAEYIVVGCGGMVCMAG